jgi:hypothetical protein
MPWQVSLNSKAIKATPVSLRFTSGGSPVVGAEVFSDSGCSNVITEVVFSRGDMAKTVYAKYNLIGNLDLTASAAGLSSNTASISTTMQFTRLDRMAGGMEVWGSFTGIGGDARMPPGAAIVSDGTYLYMSSTDIHTITRINIATRQAETVAGTFWRFGYVDGTGTSVKFFYPRGLAILNGYLYICDANNYLIRRMDLTTFAVTTVAGTYGVSGYSDGIGTAAGFTYPQGITTDGTNLYIADSRKIRKLDPSNMQVTTLAGSGAGGTLDGIGAAATFDNAFRIATDGTNLYIAENNQHIIRQMDLGTNTVTTIAGSAGVTGTDDGVGVAARFNSPSALYVDGTILYIADYTNNLIRKMDLGTGSVTTLAGAAGSSDYYVEGSFATARFNQPSGLVMEGGSLYLSERGNPVVRKLDLVNETTSLVAGVQQNDNWTTRDGRGEDARINWASGFAADAEYVYIPDCGGNAIRRMSIATRDVVTIAGTIGVAGSADGIGTAATFNCPIGVEVGNGFLYVSESANVIRKIDLTTMQVTTIAGVSGAADAGTDGVGAAARFAYPNDLVLVGTNDLYVIETNGYTIRKIDLTSNTVSTVAGQYGVRGNVDGIGSAAGFYSPQYGTVIGSYMFISDYHDNTIRRMDLTTYNVITFSGFPQAIGYVDGNAAASRYYHVNQITNDGNWLYMAEGDNQTIRRIDPTTGESTTLVGGIVNVGDRNSDISTGTLIWPTGLVWTPHGLFVGNDGVGVTWVH